MSKIVSIFALASALASAQTLTLTGSATARPGTSITVNLTLASPSANLAGIQWSVGLPPGYIATATAGAASTAAAKSIYCNPASTLCLAVGVNTNVYSAGGVAAYQIVVPAGAAPGQATVPLSGIVGATLLGDNAPLAAGPPYTFNVLSKSDLNGDGKVDMLDLQLMIQEILAGSAANDQNGDGMANVQDAQVVARQVAES